MQFSLMLSFSSVFVEKGTCCQSAIETLSDCCAVHLKCTKKHFYKIMNRRQSCDMINQLQPERGKFDSS